jgi:DNA-binding MarR family transcriptional regulator
MYRLIGDNHSLGGLPFSAQVFVRSLDRVRGRLARDADVTRVELQALGRIAEESDINTSSLAQHLDATLATTESVVHGLVERGLVTPLLTLTPAGHTLMDKVYRDFQGSILDAAESLDDERRYAFESAMLKMARKLDDAAER